MKKIIAAVSKNGVIGSKGKLPWHLSKDLKYFKELTTPDVGVNALLVGPKTYKSLPKQLHDDKHRKLIVEQGNVNKIYTEYNDVFIIGGESLYKKYVGYAEKMYITHVKKDFDGDRYFPMSDIKKYDLIKRSETFIENGIPFHFAEYMLRHEEQQYLDAIKTICQEGLSRGSKGRKTKSKLGVQMRFSLDKGFPLLTTKKMFWKGIVEELLWFLRGETDVSILNKKGIHIWDKNVTSDYLSLKGLNYKEGDPGPIYGHSFRHYGAKYTSCNDSYDGKGVDQLQNVIDLLEKRPMSRRIIIDLWNPVETKKMALPPCHILYQFYVTPVKNSKDKLNLSMYQRSGDMGLGVPFNIASASLLTHIVAAKVNMDVGEFVYTLGDAHVYTDHIVPLKKQIKRKPYQFPSLIIDKTHADESLDVYIKKLSLNSFKLKGYKCHGTVKMPLLV